MADSSIPQSWNLYAYAANNPFKYVDPTGTDWCAWDDGTHDDAPENGGANYQDCVKQGGTWEPDLQESVTVFANAGLTQPPFISYVWNAPHAQSPFQIPTNAPNKTPCTKSARYRVTQGVLGAVNLGLAGVKTAGLVASDGLLAIATPFTGGASAAVAAVGTVYGVTSISGQAIAGSGQLYTAFGGNPSVGEQISQVGDILSGPVTGISTLVGTGGNMAQAQQVANVESAITAGAGLVNSKGFGEAVDFGLSLFGLSGAGCHP